MRMIKILKKKMIAAVIAIMLACSVNVYVPEAGAAVIAENTNVCHSASTNIRLKYSVKGKTKKVAKSKTPVGMHGRLRLKKVKGYDAPIIVDKNGKPFQLRGASTHGIQWGEMAPYVNKKAFQSLRDEWGVNAVRLACYVTQGGYVNGGSYVQAAMDKKIEEGVKAARELGMYVIIDWHIHAENPLDYTTEAKRFFKKYAKKYRSYENVIFEICNEPTGVEWYNGSGRDLYTYGKTICRTIRKTGNNSLIVCGTNTWSQDVDDVAKKPLSKAGIKNVLYTFHFYSATHYDYLMDKVKKATADGTPIFVTEFGVCDASGNGNYDLANANKWIKLCDRYNISYCCWSLCNKNESASYIKPQCSKLSNWKGSDLSTTGKWLVNTYRARAKKSK